jgi:probable phosphoglycerate mutase
VRGVGEGAKMRNIYVVRHTEAEHHIQKLGGGWYDTSLTEKGRAQAQKVAESLFNEIKLTGIPIYSSDLKRCLETVEIFSKVFNSKVTLDRNLREMNFGEGGGKTREWYDVNTIPMPTDETRIDHRIFKNAESRREVGQRAVEFVNHLMNEQDENVILITHGFISTFLISAWLKVPVENMDYINFKTNSSGVDLLSEDDFWKSRNVVYFNRLDFLNR